MSKKVVSILTITTFKTFFRFDGGFGFCAMDEKNKEF